MFLEITPKSLGKNSIFEYVASSIESKFPDSKDDANKIRNAKTNEEVESVFNDYYEGWKYDNVNFLFGDVDNIIYWIGQEIELYKKELEYKKWVNWLADRGFTPEKLKKSHKKSS